MSAQSSSLRPYGSDAPTVGAAQAAYRRLRFRLGARVLPDARALRRHRLRLAKRFLCGDGVEIGALHLPLPLPTRTHVRYVDRYDREGLRRAYPEMAGVPFVDVDIVDDGERLAAFGDATQDFVVANHFYEHTEDPIGTLRNHLRVLRDRGILYLAVPDKRFTFDVDRPVTELEHHMLDHSEGPIATRRAHFEEWARIVDGVPDGDVGDRAAQLDAEDYSIHFHVWTPAAFVDLLQYCRRTMGLPFEIEAVQPHLHEFVTILRRTSPTTI